jgi:hypothetical protein
LPDGKTGRPLWHQFVTHARDTFISRASAAFVILSAANGRSLDVNRNLVFEVLPLDASGDGATRPKNSRRKNLKIAERKKGQRAGVKPRG